jgi:transcriptional regulator with XRE-family HTH domain
MARHSAMGWLAVHSSAVSPISLRLRELRQAKGLTQQQLATLAGVRRATISDIERSPKRIDLETLERLCTALRCAPEDLIVIEKGGRRK